MASRCTSLPWLTPWKRAAVRAAMVLVAAPVVAVQSVAPAFVAAIVVAPLLVAPVLVAASLGAAVAVVAALAGAVVVEFAAERLALGGIGMMLVVALAARPVAIGHAMAMRRIVVPVIVVIVVAVEIVGDVGRPVDVDRGVAVAAAPAAPSAPAPTAAPAAAPVPAAEKGAADREAQAEAEAAAPAATAIVSTPAVVGRRKVGRRIVGIGPRSIGPVRVVGRHVDGVRIGRLDHDRGRRAGRRAGARRLLRHGLLRRGLEVAGGLRLGAQPLDGGGHIGLLGDHRVAHLLGPVELAVHHRQDLRKGHERRHADVPALVLDRSEGGVALEAGIVLRPARRLDHLQRIARRHQGLRQQRIGIEGNRRQQLVELLRRERLGGVRCSARRCRRRLCCAGIW